VDPRSLTRAELNALKPADLPRLPKQVRDFITTPTGGGSSETIKPLDDASGASALSGEVCRDVARDSWRTNSVGWKLMEVRNSARVCTDDGVYHSITPIDKSQAWGNWGYVFSSWNYNSSGFCESSHLRWYHGLVANFRYGYSPDVFRVYNETTFQGSGGKYAGEC
jgi:hypothetical protein